MMLNESPPLILIRFLLTVSVGFPLASEPSVKCPDVPPIVLVETWEALKASVTPATIQVGEPLERSNELPAPCSAEYACITSFGLVAPLASKFGTTLDGDAGFPS